MIQANKLFFIITFLLILAGVNISAMNNEIQLKLNNSTLRIQIKKENIIRITHTAAKSFSQRKSLSVLDFPSNLKWKKEEDKTNIYISTDSVVISVNKSSGLILIQNKNSKEILKVNAIDENSLKIVTVQGENVFEVKQNFSISKDEALYGLGQFEDALFNWRGKEVLISQANRTAVNPFLVSTNGYGIFWDNYSETKFCDLNGETYFSSKVADEIDFYFVYGPTIDQVIAGYRKLTGEAPMFGKWAYGYWQSKERYMTGNELIGIVKEYRKRNIPFDNIIQDWQYWGENSNFSGMIWTPDRFPDPKKMIDTLHKLNSHIIASIWPAFGNGSAIYKEMDKKGFLYPLAHWCGGKVYDAYNPEARKTYWKYVKNGLFNNGIDGYWMDGSEPEFRCTDDRYITGESVVQTGKNYLGISSRYLNPFSLVHSKGVYEGHRASTSQKRSFILTRSVFSGQQRNGTVLWSGDTFASWDNLRVQVAAGINISMSGIPYWNSDIGGFIVDSRFPEGCKNESYRELYVRWFQFGAFCPMFRSHGTSTPREMWQFGDKGYWAYNALVKFDKLRYRLMPYIYSTAWQVTNNGYSFMRALASDFSNDKKTFSIGSQYMFGSSILVAPVLKEMYYPNKNKSIDITTDKLFSPDGKEAGADLFIYKGTNFDKLVMKRKTDASGIAWFGCLPLELDSSYTVRFDGKLLSENAGEYKFSIVTDGGIRFSINNNLLVDEWNNMENKTYSPEVKFDSNTKYSFKLEYKQLKPNNANLKITWTKPALTNALEKTIDVYLPSGANWFDFWTGKIITGGKTIKAETPIDVMPLFIPAGSIIPLGPDIQYSSEKVDPIEIRIYPGKNGSFDLYEDENDNYNYEKGKHSVITFKWNEAAKELTINNRVGKFKGMLQQRKFNIVIVKESYGVGEELTPNTDQVIFYNGKKVTRKF